MESGSVVSTLLESADVLVESEGFVLLESTGFGSVLMEFGSVGFVLVESVGVVGLLPALVFPRICPIPSLAFTHSSLILRFTAFFSFGYSLKYLSILMISFT